jgi:uroporphyrinogen decarboxylase
VKTIREFVLSAPHRVAMPLLSFPGARLAGCSVGAMVIDPTAQVAAQRALQAKFGTPFLLTAMDLSVEAEAFGARIFPTETEVPTVTGRLVTTGEEIARLAVPGVGAGRTGVYLEVARRLAAAAGGDQWPLGGIIGPFSLAGRLFGVSELLLETADHPAVVHALLAKVTDFLAAYARAFKQAGARGLIVAEPAAGLISPPAMREFSSTYVRRIAGEVADDGFEIILHNCGARAGHLAATLEAGAAIIHFGRPMDLAVAFSRAPADVVVCGNLDPAVIFVEASAEVVRERTLALLQTGRDRRGFVISSGCDIPPTVPPANLDAFFAAVAEFNAAG